MKCEISDRKAFENILENVSRTMYFKSLVMGIMVKTLKECGVKRKTDEALVKCVELMENDSIEELQKAYTEWLINE